MHVERLETILREGPALRDLARSLLASEHDVEDALQETWIQLIENPPRQPEAIRGWLHRVLRNNIYGRFRTLKRRPGIERRAAASGEAPSTAELVADAELHSHVARSVLELREPYRRTVLLRYFHGMPLKRIAECEGIEPSSARARLHRGLGMLRDQLKADLGRDLRPLAVLVAPLCADGTADTSPAAEPPNGVDADDSVASGSPADGASPGIGTIGTKLAVPAGLVALALVAFVGLSRLNPFEIRGAGDSTSEATDGMSFRILEREIALTDARKPRATPAPVGPAPSAASSDDTAGTITYEGIVVGPNDRGIAAASVEALRTDRTADLFRTSALPAGERVASTVCDDEGRFTLEVPRGALPTILARAEGYAPTSEFQPPPDREVRIRARRGARIEGTVVRREDGSPVVGALVDADVIEQPNGSVNVLVSGQLLVASERARALDFTQLTNEDFRVSFADSGEEVAIRDGELRGLFDFAKDVLPDLRGRLDELAQNLIFEFNRVHSTGVPRDGSFSSLTSTYPVTTDIGPPALVPLSQTNLPFPPEASDLRISVVNESTGEIEQTTISIDPETQSLTNVATLLSSVANIEASVDGVGILHIQAAEGYTFDFSSRLDPDPDTIGSFGGTTATIGGTNGGPFALADGDELQIEVDGGVAQTVTFNTGDFADIAAATAEEVVAAIQAQTSGVSASIVGGRVVLQSLTDGSTGSLQLTNVTNDPLGTIGLSAVLETGTDDPPVEVRASGTYSGEGARNLRFVASGNGEIGVTPGLTVDVYDEDGSLLRTLSVGDGYVPGSELSVSDGIQISFGEGAISADAGDTFEVRAVSDSDTGDFLAALGINAFFTGENAANIDVVQAIQDDPTLIAGGLSGSPGDNENFLKLLSLQEEKIGSLRGETIEGFYGNLVADVGSDGLRSLQFFESQTVLTEFLAQQRDSVSGVSLDEEAVNLLQFQRSFEAAARYISVVDSTMLEVLSLVR